MKRPLPSSLVPIKKTYSTNTDDTDHLLGKEKKQQFKKTALKIFKESILPLDLLIMLSHLITVIVRLCLSVPIKFMHS